MSITPVPAVSASPATADVKNVVDLMKEAQSAWGIFSALTRKKAAVAIIGATLLWTIGIKVAVSLDVWVSLYFFAFGTALLLGYIFAQAWVDVAQMWAIGQHAPLSDTETAEND